jgi:hypothetical protein
MTFTGTREELRERLAQLEASGATGIIFGTSGYDVERELRAYAEVAGLRWNDRPPCLLLRGGGFRRRGEQIPAAGRLRENALQILR